MTAILANGADRLWAFWINQIGGTFLSPGSTFALGGLVCTLLLAAFLAVPRGRKTMPRLAVWRRALLPNRLVATASGRADIAYFLFSLLLAGLVFGWALLSSGPIADATAGLLAMVFGPARPFVLPQPLIVAGLTIGLFIAYEFAYWLDHYLSHKIPALWQFHRVHHAAESLSLLTNFRVHPVDTIVFVNIVAIVLGISTGVARHLLGPLPQVWGVGGTNMIIMVCAILLNHLQHSHLWITFGPRWGRWVLSPAHHQIHHSADPRHFDRNFGSTLAIFDRLFGTLHMPGARRDALRFGLDGAIPEPHGLKAALIEPFASAIALIGRRDAPAVVPETIPAS